MRASRFFLTLIISGLFVSPAQAMSKPSPVLAKCSMLLRKTISRWMPADPSEEIREALQGTLYAGYAVEALPRSLFGRGPAKFRIAELGVLLTLEDGSLRVELESPVSRFPAKKYAFPPGDFFEEMKQTLVQAVNHAYATHAMPYGSRLWVLADGPDFLGWQIEGWNRAVDFIPTNQSVSPVLGEKFLLRAELGLGSVTWYAVDYKINEHPIYISHQPICEFFEPSGAISIERILDGAYERARQIIEQRNLYSPTFAPLNPKPVLTAELISMSRQIGLDPLDPYFGGLEYTANGGMEVFVPSLHQAGRVLSAEAEGGTWQPDGGYLRQGLRVQLSDGVIQQFNSDQVIAISDGMLAKQIDPVTGLRVRIQVGDLVWHRDTGLSFIVREIQDRGPHINGGHSAKYRVQLAEDSDAGIMWKESTQLVPQRYASGIRANR